MQIENMKKSKKFFDGQIKIDFKWKSFACEKD